MLDTYEQYTKHLHETYGTSLLSKEQAAKELNISRATLDRLRKHNRISGKRIGKFIRIPVQEIARFVTEEYTA
jgi:excisionase family DNA binding protein